MVLDFKVYFMFFWEVLESLNRVVIVENKDLLRYVNYYFISICEGY